MKTSELLILITLTFITFVISGGCNDIVEQLKTTNIVLTQLLEK